ncbi:MAG: hypothetical protein IJ272_11040 [Clostridia bacterium]|nr:hypothetical protein [Clostridia bacterium]
MKISGTRGNIWFDLENGYIMKAQGELLMDGKFVVYTDTMKSWETPYDKEMVTQEQVNNVIKEAIKVSSNFEMTLIFE